MVLFPVAQARSRFVVTRLAIICPTFFTLGFFENMVIATPSEVVSMIWQYLKLPEESRKRVTANLIDVDENCEKEDFQVPDLYDIVPKEEIAEFEDIMRKIITGII